jgi:hypothetical protein
MCLPKSHSHPLPYGMNVSSVPLLILEILQKGSVLGILDLPVLCLYGIPYFPTKITVFLSVLKTEKNTHFFIFFFTIFMFSGILAKKLNRQPLTL